MCTSGSGTPIEQFSRFIAGLSFPDLPGDVVTKTKIHIADTLGAGLAGARSNEFDIATKVVSAPGPVTAWGTQRTMSSRDAAFVNGVSAHAFELDDSGGCDHSGAVVIPALFARLEESTEQVSGKAFIAAVVTGYEAGRRLLDAAGGYDTHNSLGWHSTATCGPFAAAAAVASLKRLSFEETRNALTLSTSFSSGLWAFIHDGTQAKKIHAGRASEGGLVAAGLAAKGLTGPSKVFDDVWGGFFRTFNQDAGQVEILTRALGETFSMRRATLKPYASCRSTHSAIDALQDLLAETGRTPETIASVKIEASQLVADMCGARENGPMAATQMSLPYALAARIVHGSAGLDAYAEKKRRHPQIAHLMETMELDVDTDMQPLDEPVITLRFADGTELSRMVPRATGSAERPMEPSSVEAKFKTNAAMSIAPESADDLWGMTQALENLDDARTLIPFLKGGADRQPRFI